VDVRLSDMTPNMSGMDVIDHAKSSYLGELRSIWAGRVLKPHGHALIKVFQGAGFQELVQASRQAFARVKLQKPAASRSRRSEMYLLAMDYRLV
jgi:23S rRNA (uridine2552-2'-O)-methyltransferase